MENDSDDIDGLSVGAWHWWRDELGHHMTAEGLELGAAVAFGLMGMAEAIRLGGWGRSWMCGDCGRQNHGFEACCSACRDFYGARQRTAHPQDVLAPQKKEKRR